MISTNFKNWLFRVCFMLVFVIITFGSAGYAFAVAPGFAKVFSPDTIVSGGVSTLTFTIDNTGDANDATAIDFTDNLPAGTVVATPANAATTCVGGTLTAISGAGVISYTGGTVPGNTSCTISVDVVSNMIGNSLNTTGDLTSSLGNSGTASDQLIVNPVPAAASIPTLSEWGMIFFAALLGFIAVVHIKKTV